MSNKYTAQLGLIEVQIKIGEVRNLAQDEFKTDPAPTETELKAQIAAMLDKFHTIALEMERSERWINAILKDMEGV